jgi:hypothetical protein
LESEIRRLLSKAESRMANLPDINIFSEEAPALSLEVADKIDNVRAELAQIDYSLKDITKIINGYVSYRSTEALQQQLPQQQAPPETLQDTLQQSNIVSENVQEAIENFRNQISTS